MKYIENRIANKAELCLNAAISETVNPRENPNVPNTLIPYYDY